MSPLPDAIITHKARIQRFLKFAVVGGSGVVVNLTVFQLTHALLSPLAPTPRLLTADAAGITVSIFTNFLLNDRWTWGDRVKGKGAAAWGKRLALYYATCSIAAAIQLVTSWATHTHVLSHMSWLSLLDHDLRPGIAVLTGIAAGIAINFPLSHLWTFKDEHPQAP